MRPLKAERCACSVGTCWENGIWSWALKHSWSLTQRSGAQQVDEWIFLSICMCVCGGGVADGSALVAEVTQMDLLPVRQAGWSPLWEKIQEIQEAFPGNPIPFLLFDDLLQMHSRWNSSLTCWLPPSFPSFVFIWHTFIACPTVLQALC